MLFGWSSNNIKFSSLARNSLVCFVHWHWVSRIRVKSTASLEGNKRSHDFSCWALKSSWTNTRTWGFLNWYFWRWKLVWSVGNSCLRAPISRPCHCETLCSSYSGWGWLGSFSTLCRKTSRQPDTYSPAAVSISDQLKKHLMIFSFLMQFHCIRAM